MEKHVHDDDAAIFASRLVEYIHFTGGMNITGYNVVKVIGSPTFYVPDQEGTPIPGTTCFIFHFEIRKSNLNILIVVNLRISECPKLECASLDLQKWDVAKSCKIMEVLGVWLFSRTRSLGKDSHFQKFS